MPVSRHAPLHEGMQECSCASTVRDLAVARESDTVDPLAIALSRCRAAEIKVSCSSDRFDQLLLGVALAPAVRQLTVQCPSRSREAFRPYLHSECGRALDELFQGPSNSIRELVIHPPCHPSVGIVIGRAMQRGAPLVLLQCSVMDPAQAPPNSTGPSDLFLAQVPAVPLKSLPKKRQLDILRAYDEMATGIAKSQHVTSLGACPQSLAHMMRIGQCMRSSLSLNRLLLGFNGVSDAVLPGVITELARCLDQNRLLVDLGRLDFRHCLGQPRRAGSMSTLPQLAQSVHAHPLVLAAQMVVPGSPSGKVFPAVKKACSVLADGIGGGAFMGHASIAIGSSLIAGKNKAGMSSSEEQLKGAVQVATMLVGQSMQVCICEEGDHGHANGASLRPLIEPWVNSLERKYSRLLESAEHGAVEAMDECMKEPRVFAVPSSAAGTSGGRKRRLRRKKRKGAGEPSKTSDSCQSSVVATLPKTSQVHALEAAGGEPL